MFRHVTQPCLLFLTLSFHVDFIVDDEIQLPPVREVFYQHSIAGYLFKDHLLCITNVFNLRDIHCPLT